jgi:hypothetical protein
MFFKGTFSREFDRMRRVSIKGVLLGWAAATATSAVFGSMVLIAVLARVGRNTHGLFHRYPALLVLVATSGLVFFVLGGYLSARIARHDEMLNGGLISFACVLVSLFQTLAGKTTLVTAFLTLVAAPACGAFGGYLRLRQKNAETHPA